MIYLFYWASICWGWIGIVNLAIWLEVSMVQKQDRKILLMSAILEDSGHKSAVYWSNNKDLCVAARVRISSFIMNDRCGGIFPARLFD